MKTIQTTALLLIFLLGLCACGDTMEESDDPSTGEVAASEEEIVAALEDLEAQSQQTPAPEEVDLGGGKADLASNVFYECITGTQAGSTRWTYKTSLINNTRGSIEVFVYQSANGTARAFGPLRLNKEGTDLWKEPQGKLTLRLVQHGASKSIRVYHNQVRLLSSERNGWCKTIDPVSSIRSEYRKNFFYGGRSILNGRWRFIAVNDQLLDTETPYGFTFNHPHSSDPLRRGKGTMQTYRRCNPIGTDTYTPPVTGFNARGLNLLQLALDAVDLITRSVESYRCTTSQDFVLPTTRAYDMYLWDGREDGRLTVIPLSAPADFLSQCGTGNDTMFFQVADAQRSLTILMCAQVFDPGNGSSPYMRVRAYNRVNNDITQWATLIRD